MFLYRKILKEHKIMDMEDIKALRHEVFMLNLKNIKSFLTDFIFAFGECDESFFE